MREAGRRSGREYLDEDRVFRGADKTPDTQFLLNLLEEKLDLPAFFVDVDDGNDWSEIHSVCRFPDRGSQSGAAQRLAHMGDFDDVIRCDAACATQGGLQQLVDRMRLSRVTKEIFSGRVPETTHG